MKAGFTGTRNETTYEQHHALTEFLKRQHDMTEFHHGCCIGADSEAQEAVELMPRVIVHAHPPLKTGLMSKNALEFSKVKHEPKGEEHQRSGTWSTIRYAKKQGKPVWIFWPDGAVEESSP